MKNKRKLWMAVATISVMSFSLLSPAQAADKEGGDCTTKGAKAQIKNPKTGKFNNFICDNNPAFKPAQLTWTWDGCIEIRDSINSQVAQDQAVDAATSTINAQIEKTAKSLNMLLAWNATTSYAKGDIVYFVSSGAKAYYVAKSNNKNVRPIGASASKSRWSLNTDPLNSTGAGKVPDLDQAVATAKTKITALQSVSTAAATAATMQTRVNDLQSQVTELKRLTTTSTIALFSPNDLVQSFAGKDNLMYQLNIIMMQKCKP